MKRVARRAAMAGAAALLFAAAACASSGGPSPAASPAVVDTTTFAPDLAVDLKQFTRMASGMYYFDAVKGNGTVAADGRKVTIRYSVYLPTGSLVDAQRQPLELDVDETMLKGLRYGLVGMHAGGQRRLILTPSLGYGRSQHGNIPPNSILLFDVELIAVR